VAIIERKIRLPIELCNRMDQLGALADLTGEQMIQAIMVLQLHKEGWIRFDEAGNLMERKAPTYYFARTSKIKSGVVGHSVFQFTLKDYFDLHGCLDDRSAMEAATFLPDRFQRVMDSTYIFNGKASEGIKILQSLGNFENPRAFQKFVDRRYTGYIE
jgi:hypothetical protein